MVFDLASIEIQWVLDKALFLKGKTIDGKDVIGSVSTKLSGCDVSHPDVRPKHEKKQVPTQSSIKSVDYAKHRHSTAL